MDPLTALGLAASIVQFVEFSVSILGKSREIHRSAGGISAENTDLEIVEADLSRWTYALTYSVAPAGVALVLVEDDQAIVQLCKRCASIAAELRDALESVRTKGRKTRWKSVRTALKSIWKKEAIEGLRNKLVGIRDELESRIVAGLRSRIDFMQVQQLEGFASLDKAVQDLAEIWLTSQVALRNQFEDQTVHIDASVLAVERATKQAIDEASQRSDDGHTCTLSQMARQNAEAQSQRDLIKTEITRQWQSAEGQIAQLKEEIVALKSIVASAVDKTMKAHSGLKRQKALQEQTNLLYRVWTAKEVMLQKLEELVTMLKAGLANGDWISRLPKLNLPKLEDLARHVNTPKADDRESKLHLLMSAIKDADPAQCKVLATQDIINSKLLLAFDAHRPENNALKFYHSMYPSYASQKAGLVRKYDHYRVLDRSEVHQPGPYGIWATPLLWTVQEIWQLSIHTVSAPGEGTVQSYNERRLSKLLSILDLLLDCGAERRVLDNGGLSAYDHARILGLDAFIATKLRPIYNTISSSGSIAPNLITVDGPSYPEIRYPEIPGESLEIPRRRSYLAAELGMTRDTELSEM